MRWMLAFLFVGVALTGCIGGDDGAVSPNSAEFHPCIHPWPCADGSEWPLDLVGPFELGETLTDPIASFDGIELETTIYRPDLPEGVGAPVVLWSQPYTGTCPFNGLGSCMAESDSAFIYEGGYRIDPETLVENGYAVAIVNVRGTGNSQGCYELGGPNEQQDQVFLVEHLADQAWSNGRVAMIGHSYHGWTPWMAAIQAPSALKAVVASGLITDPYTFTFSPQGGTSSILGPFWTGFVITPGTAPPVGGSVEHFTVDHAQALATTLCPELVEAALHPPVSHYAEVRDAAFWDERRLITGFPNITAATMVVQGFNDDSFESAHAFQDDDVWTSLPETTPRRMVLGQWGHDLPPPPDFLDNAPFGSDWHEDTLLPWLDHWLKGVGEPAQLGTAWFQDSALDWHVTTAWPPAEVREEVLYLGPDGALAPVPSDGARSYRSLGPVVAACGVGLPAAEPTMLVYASEPLEEPATLAGNPFAYLQLESDQPGGRVVVNIVDLDEDASCAPLADPPNAVVTGIADLRFHGGNYVAEDFPMNTPTAVRIDLYNEAYVFEAGHRIGVYVSPDYTEGLEELPRTGPPWSPRITVHGGAGPDASHIVLPFVSGTLGGAAPTLDYPAQPFLPRP